MLWYGHIGSCYLHTTIQIVASSLEITRDCISKLKIFIRACSGACSRLVIALQAPMGLVIALQAFTTSTSLVTRLVV